MTKKSTLEKVDQAQAELAEQDTWADRIERQKPQLAKTLPKGIDPDRYARVALSTIKNPSSRLAECDPITVLSGVMDAASLGLELQGPLGQAYLIPRWSGKNKRMEASFQIGYQGMREIAWRSGITLEAVTVRERDHYIVRRGTDPQIDHQYPDDPAVERGDIVAFYATALFPDGRRQFETMSLREMEEFRDQFRAQKDGGPWDDHFESMALKTMVKQLAKSLPKSTELGQAVALDSAPFAQLRQPLDPVGNAPSEDLIPEPAPGDVDEDDIEEAEIVDDDDGE